MDKIYYNNDEYTKQYEHEGGGTYFISETANIVTSWLDVSPDGTVKYLFRLFDGEYVETVVMKYKYGYTICVSSVNFPIKASICSYLEINSLNSSIVISLLIL